uniref:Checkpoint protein n=1 Tax=Schistosoma japonicum TaxID=6182 RepID=Q5DGF4_SCHJA|nr:SJCHGC09161 protein [Schistosoma japonicum]
MKFRIKTNDPGCIEYFSNIVQMVAGLAKNVILHLNKGQLSFVIKERVVFGGITAWCDLEHAVLFSERICEGISPDQDEIFLELIMDHLLHCIRSNTLSTSNHNSLYSSSSTSNSCTTMNKSRIGSNSLTGNFDPSICRLLGLKIKLVRRKTPCLAIELEQSSVTGRSRSVWHFIPVQVVPPRLWDEFIEPPDPDFDVSIFFPPVKTLRPFVDRMKKFAKFVIISANGSGELNFSINVESLACVKLTFRGLKARSWMLQESLLSEINDSMDEVRSTVWDSNDVDLDRSKQINDDPNKKLVSVSLDLRRISQLLSSPKIVPSCFVCNIIHEKLAQFLMLFDNHKLKFNIPASNL